MKRVYILIVLLTFILNCGNGAPTPPVGKDNVNPYLQMHPPLKWTDNTALVPERDLSFWRIYAMNLDNNNAASWFDESNEVGQMAVVNKGMVLTDFNLNLLRPFLDNGTYMIGIKVQALDGQQSEFADNTVLWEKK